jgi:hypothetical protein
VVIEFKVRVADVDTGKSTELSYLKHITITIIAMQEPVNHGNVLAAPS